MSVPINHKPFLFKLEHVQCTSQGFDVATEKAQIRRRLLASLTDLVSGECGI